MNRQSIQGTPKNGHVQMITTVPNSVGLGITESPALSSELCHSPIVPYGAIKGSELYLKNI